MAVSAALLWQAASGKSRNCECQLALRALQKDLEVLQVLANPLVGGLIRQSPETFGKALRWFVEAIRHEGIAPERSGVVENAINPIVGGVDYHISICCELEQDESRLGDLVEGSTVLADEISHSLVGHANHRVFAIPHNGFEKESEYTSP